jgi:hypothetical protein
MLMTRRITLETQPLSVSTISCDQSYGVDSMMEEGAYKIPATKTADVLIFFLNAICKRHIQTIGRKRIRKSDTTLNIAAAKIGPLILMQ